MKKLLVIILSCLLCIPTAEAQKRKKQEAQKDTIQVPLLNGVSINAEVMGLGQKLFKDHGQYEVGIRVNLKDRYFPAFEIGYGEGNDNDGSTSSPTDINKYCRVKAPYFRVGMDYNLLRNKHDKYRLFVGGRYGFSSFDYNLADAEQQKATYQWLEALIGIDVTVWKMFHLGWDVRWRKQLSHKDGEAGMPWFVPGYGYQKTEVEGDRRKAGFTLRYYISIGI